MSTPATTALEALKTHLAGITTVNGYAITVASVTSGRSALALDTAGPFPAITLTPTQDAPAEGLLQPGQRYQAWNRTVILEAALLESADGEWDAELDTLWDALRTALGRYTGILVWGPVEFVSPQEGGGICLLRLPLTLPYSLIVE